MFGFGSLEVARLIREARANTLFFQQLVKAPDQIARARRISPIVTTAAAHTLSMARVTNSGVWW